MWAYAKLPTTVVPQLYLYILLYTLQLYNDTLITLVQARQYCLPSSKCWPDAEIWGAFNRSIGGRLLRPRPPAAPCYNDSSHEQHYDAAECETARQNWHNPYWRGDEAGAMQSPNREADGDAICELNTTLSNTICYQGAVPLYSVLVSQASHVQSAVAFAAQHNLMLTVKSTGHDLMGRSTALASLNIWMHHLKDIAFFDAFRPAGCSSDVETVAAVRAGAGVQWYELYKAADERGRVVVGGMSSTVSTAGGYLQGGGHSPLSPLLGLAADNVMELRVVTADGRLRTANACQNQDLFWALRGGGGGTFGVVMSATHKTFSALSSVLGVRFTAHATSLSSFEALMTRFIELQAWLSDSDSWAGYSYFSFTTITGSYLLPRMKASSSCTPPEEVAIAAFEPITTYADQHPNEMNYSITVNVYPSFLAWHRSVQCSANPGICSDATGSHAAIASRLLPKELLVRSNAKTVSRAFMEVLVRGVQYMIGHLVGGRAVASPNTNNSVNPAWRTALWHVILASTWTADEAGAATEKARMRLLTQANGLLRELAPNSGCYINEADFNEPDWPTAFFGRNYGQLCVVKQQVDPQALFTCRNCVGTNLQDDYCRRTT